MAKENVVFLHGQIISPPKVYAKSDGQLTKGYVILKVIRRPTNSNQILANKNYFDCPIIMTKNEEMIREICKLKANDMVDIKGVLCTKEVTKSTKCPECGHVNQTKGNYVYIHPIYLCKREDGLVTDENGIGINGGLTPEEGLELLKKRAEISNMIMVIGELCRDPESHTDEKGREYAQYQIAVNRKYRILEDAPDKKTDYPWVKTFGNQALEDSRGLHLHSKVYINGALQTREITRHTECEECGHIYDWNEGITEIVPYSTDYLENCDIPEPDDNTEE